MPINYAGKLHSFLTHNEWHMQWNVEVVILPAASCSLRIKLLVFFLGQRSWEVQIGFAAANLFAGALPKTHPMHIYRIHIQKIRGTICHCLTTTVLASVQDEPSGTPPPLRLLEVVHPDAIKRMGANLKMSPKSWSLVALRNMETVPDLNPNRGRKTLCLGGDSQSLSHPSIHHTNFRSHSRTVDYYGHEFLLGPGIKRAPPAHVV